MPAAHLPNQGEALVGTGGIIPIVPDQIRASLAHVIATITTRRATVKPRVLRLEWDGKTRFKNSSVPSFLRITTGGRIHPNMSTVQSMRDVVIDYTEHPETKSLGTDGQPCAEKTTGLLRRRHVRPSWVQHIGKEANRFEDVEGRDVPEWDEVLERSEPRGQGEWELEVLPVLSRLRAKRVAQAAGMSVRQVIRILKSGRRPPPRNAVR